MKRKIAFLTNQYPATSHTFIKREIAELRRKGLDVLTYSIRRPSNDETEADSDRHEFERTYYLLPPTPDVLRAHFDALRKRPGKYLATLREALRHRVPGARSGLWSVMYFGEAITLARQLERDGVEHLHNHFANAGSNVGYLASRFLDIDWSVTLHGTADFDYPAGPLLAKKIGAAKFVACVSSFGRAQAMRITDPDQWEKMFINRCGIELSGRPDGRERQWREGEPLRFLTVGRLSPEKGHFGLISAFSRAVEQGLDAELFLVGDGPLQDSVFAHAEAQAHGKRVHFLGRMDEDAVSQELSKADVFVLSSFMEGLPVVLMEALAQRVPVIAPNVAGVGELVEHERSGLLFAASDWPALEEAMLRLGQDPALRVRLAEDGRRRIEEEFDIARAVEPIFERLRD